MNADEKALSYRRSFAFIGGHIKKMGGAGPPILFQLR
jgi:hypothetical protein